MEEEDEASDYSIPREITTMSHIDDHGDGLSSTGGSMHGGNLLLEDPKDVELRSLWLAQQTKTLVVRSMDVSDKNTAVKVAINE